MAQSSVKIDTQLTLAALKVAIDNRKPAPGTCIHHSDRGSQYASDAYRAALKNFGLLGSMSRKGNCWDNAPMESFFSSLKNERTHGQRYATREEARQDAFEYIGAFYNRSRRHSALG